MVTTMSLDQARGHLADLLANAADGEEVVIVRDDGSRFSVVPTHAPPRKQGIVGNIEGKLRLDHSVLDLAITIPAMYGYESWSITPHRLDALSRLPLHHRDPFDRLLVAPGRRPAIAHWRHHAGRLRHRTHVAAPGLVIHPIPPQRPHRPANTGSSRNRP